MKYSLIIISILITLACNYDLKYYSNIIGIWNCDKIIGETKFESCEGDKFRFVEDRTYIMMQSDNIVKGYYKIDGNKIHFGEVGSMVVSYRILDIEGDTMKWESLDQNEKFVIQFVKE